MAETPVVPGSYGEARRRARPGGEITHADAVPEPAPDESLERGGAEPVATGSGHAVPGAPGALRPREGGGIVAGAELARAFQANADALRNLGTMQSEMLQALTRSDRSEMILASTQTLNDTFRHLTLIQRELLGRLERAEDRRPGGRAVPLLLLGLMAIVVFATWAILDSNDRAGVRSDPGELTERSLELLQKERAAATATVEADAKRARKELDEQEERSRALEAQLDRVRDEHLAAQRDLTLKETELDGLRHQFGTAQGEALKVPSLESEIRDLTAKVAVGEPRLRQMQDELEEMRRENSRLRKKIAGARAGFPEDDPGAEPTPRPVASTSAPFPPAVPAGAPEAAALTHEAPAPDAHAAETSAAQPPPTPAPTPPAARESEGSHDPRVLTDVRSRLNHMFEAAGSRRPEYWQVMRVDAVTLDRLRGVIVNRYDSEGRVVESIEAREAFVWVERDKRRVMLELRQGESIVEGRRKPLAEGKFQTVVGEGEPITQVFASSGLRLIGSR